MASRTEQNLEVPSKVCFIKFKIHGIKCFSFNVIKDELKWYLGYDCLVSGSNKTNFLKIKWFVAIQIQLSCLTWFKVVNTILSLVSGTLITSIGNSRSWEWHFGHYLLLQIFLNIIFIVWINLRYVVLWNFTVECWAVCFTILKGFSLWPFDFIFIQRHLLICFLRFLYAVSCWHRFNPNSLDVSFFLQLIPKGVEKRISLCWRHADPLHFHLSIISDNVITTSHLSSGSTERVRLK